MSLTTTDIKKIANLAKLNMSEADTTLYATQLSNILDFVKQMDQVDTTHAIAITSALDLSQRQREDLITEPDQREKFQAIAPMVSMGLYLVPKVIEGE